MKKEKKTGRIFIDLNINPNKKVDYQLEISCSENPKDMFDAMASLIIENETLYKIIKVAMFKVEAYQDKLTIEWEKKRKLERKKEQTKN